MKTIAQIIFFTVLSSLLVYVILYKLEESNKICAISIQEINNKLISGQEFTYESNQDQK